jgi:glutamate racemase
VPAIKPAAARTRSGLISVLATPGTIERDYTRGLIESFAREASVMLVGSARLASIAEAFMRGEDVADGGIAGEIAPAFIEANGRRTDTVVLACTHYPLLLDRFERLAPWPVRWIDPAPAIARRVVELVGPATGAPAPAQAQAIFTSGRKPSADLAVALANFGLKSTEFARTADI